MDEFNVEKLNNYVSKPWGGFYDLVEKKGDWHLKIICVKKGERLSLQRHKKRNEFWIVAEGLIKAQKGDVFHELGPKEYVFIEKEEIHRVEALEDSVFVEITYGLHDEEDIERLEDDYNRQA